MESASQTLDVVIVSAYGRGNWMAGELARRGWNVKLVDVTKTMGAWEPEDWEGPWGFFDTNELLPSQRERLQSDGSTHPVPGGFTLWMPQGPLELHGPLSSFHSHAFEIPEGVRQYLLETESTNTSSFAAQRGLRQRPFEQTWLAHLAHAWASHVHSENAQALSTGRTRPLLAAYNVRLCSHQTYEKSLTEMEALGVRVIRNAAIVDVRLSGKSIDAIEIAAERRGVIRGRAFVWALSSLETQSLSNNVAASLFPAGPVEPKWVWGRFRVRLNDNSASRTLPPAFQILSNIFLPWSHSNFILAKRVHDPDAFVRLDLWLKVPSRFIGEYAYFEELRDEVLALLERRIPLSEPFCEKLPLEAGQTEGHSAGDSGGDSAKQTRTRTAVMVPRFGIYEANDLQRLQVRSTRNLLFDGPECWDGFDWMSQLRYQLGTMNTLERMKAAWDAAAAREAEGEATP